ncbi:50S ribosomal protein L35 [Candidatus Falkowbacteria bacterium]|nr:50S ribosomal protein L35 [Candidatus Falkowbacteria bacterium]
MRNKPFMNKLKTIQAVAKRLKVTKNKKILKKRVGQDHFNARESGKTTRRKRRATQISDTYYKNIRRFIPYS